MALIGCNLIALFGAIAPFGGAANPVLFDGAFALCYLSSSLGSSTGLACEGAQVVEEVDHHVVVDPLVQGVWRILCLRRCDDRQSGGQLIL